MSYFGLNDAWKSIQKELPLVKDLSDVLSDGIQIVSTINNIRSAVVTHKMKSFIQSLEYISEEDISDFLLSFDKDENKQTIFVESLHKALNLDDSLQIYVLTNLVKAYKEKGKFTYEEKLLYYNINQITEDDFTIYYCFYKKYIFSKQKKNNFRVDGEIKNSKIVKVVIKKFISYNILEDKSSVKMGDKSDISLIFGLTDYSQILFEMLEKYFNNNLTNACKEYLPIDIEYKKVGTIDFIL